MLCTGGFELRGSKGEFGELCYLQVDLNCEGGGNFGSVMGPLYCVTA